MVLVEYMILVEYIILVEYKILMDAKSDKTPIFNPKLIKSENLPTQNDLVSQ